MIRSFAFCLAVMVLMTSCTVNITNDKRFKNVIGVPIHTTRALKLCQIDVERLGNGDRYDLMEGGLVGDPLVGMVPPGHAVTFTQAYRTGSFGNAWESLEGSIHYRNKTYPIAYNLGPVGYGDEATWMRIYRSFDVKKPEMPR